MLIKDAGHKMKEMFCVTNALFGQSNRVQVTDVDGTMSEPKDVTCVVLQGAILRLLFRCHAP